MSKEPLKVLTESMFYVLLSLLRQDRCGTEIVQYVDDTTAGRVSLGPGTLYTILAKFEEEGLIRETAVEGRKRTYAITDRGRALYRQYAVQFEPVSNGTVYDTPAASSVEAARRVLNGEKTVEGALYFYAPALSPGTWIVSNRTYLTTIGCHRFFL